MALGKVTMGKMSLGKTAQGSMTTQTGIRRSSAALAGRSSASTCGFAALLSLVALLYLAAFSTKPAAAQEMDPRRMDPAKYASIVIDYETGRVLRSRNADKRLHPASLTKMMSLLLMFEALDQGRFTLNSRLTVSRYAAGRPPSKLGLRAGATISVDDAIRSMAVKSANDISVVMAEAIGGSEEKFAQMMTRRARQLGMRSTTFRNPHGLTDRYHLSTARDMARLTTHIIRNHADRMHYFADRYFTYGGRRMRNSNRMLGNYPGMDGMKTGYTRAAGFNLAATAERFERRLIVVVFGGRRGAWRNEHVAALLDWGFRRANAVISDRRPLPPRKPSGDRLQVASAAPLPPVIEEGATTADDPIGDLAARVGGGGFAVQVGAFRDRSNGVSAVAEARGYSVRLSDAAADVANIAGLWRARFVGLDHTTALAICQDLRRFRRGCLVVSTE